MRDEAVFLISFHSICATFCEFHARCASREFTGGEKRSEEQVRFISRDMGRTKKRIIKNFSPSDPEKARTRKVVRPSSCRSFLEQITQQPGTYKNADRFDRGSARCKARGTLFAFDFCYRSATVPVQWSSRAEVLSEETSGMCSRRSWIVRSLIVRSIEIIAPQRLRFDHLSRSKSRHVTDTKM